MRATVEASEGRTARAVAVLLMLGGGCGDTSWRGLAERLGMSDPVPPSPELMDILCDNSAGSTGTRENLTATLDRVLARVAPRPGSRVRLWMLGASVGATALVGEQTAPAVKGRSERAKAKRLEGWRESATEFFRATAAPAFSGPPIRRSPLAESVTKVGLAGSGGLPRHLVVVSDAREMSDLGDFECHQVPTEAVWLKRLEKAGALTVGSLSGAAVSFTFVTNSSMARCPVSLGRELQIRRLWQIGLKAAGAGRVAIESGPVRFSDEENPAATAD